MACHILRSGIPAHHSICLVSSAQQVYFCQPPTTTCMVCAHNPPSVRAASCRPFGRARLLLALPLILGNFLVPFLFHWDRDLCTNIVASLLTMWMTTFKVFGCTRVWAVVVGAAECLPAGMCAVVAWGGGVRGACKCRCCCCCCRLWAGC